MILGAGLHLQGRVPWGTSGLEWPHLGPEYLAYRYILYHEINSSYWFFSISSLHFFSSKQCDLKISFQEKLILVIYNGTISKTQKVFTWGVDCRVGHMSVKSGNQNFLSRKLRKLRLFSAYFQKQRLFRYFFQTLQQNTTNF